MNGESDATLSKKLRTDEQPPTFGSFRVRSDSQSRCSRERPFGNSRDREPACKPASLGRQ